MKTSRILSLFFGLAVCVFLLAQGVSQEVPMGQLRGVALMAENGRPVKGAIVTIRRAGQTGEDAFRRTLVTDKDGVFNVRRLPAGTYTVSASAKAHRLDQTLFVVEEGQRKELELQLAPVEPFLDLYASQHVFTPDETPSVEVHGFAPADEIDFKVYKIDTDKIIKAGQLEAVLSPLQTYDYRTAPPQDPATVGKLLFDTPHKIQNKDGEGVFVESLKTPKLDEGIYLIKAKAGAKSRSTYLNVTRMALVTKTFGNEVLCYTARIDTGEPMADVRVGYSNGHAFVPMATTDTQGLARYKLPETPRRPGEGGDDYGGYRAAIAVSGRSFALTSSYVYGGAKDPTRMYIYTDRPVYRPGDTVRFKGLVRKIVGNGYRLPEIKEVVVEYRSPDESLLKSETLPVSPFGSFYGSFTVSKEGATGGYTIIARTPDTKYTKYVPIQAYRKPQFRVEIKPDRPYFVRGEKASATLKCSYYFGGPVVGANVSCYITRQPVWGEFEGETGPMYDGGEYVDSVELKTDDRGEARILFDTVRKNDPKRAEQDYVYMLKAYVSDEGNQSFEAEGSVKVVRGEFALDVDASTYISSVGKPLTATVFAKSHEGRPLPGVNFRVTSYFSDWIDGKETKGDAKQAEATTDDDGRKTVTLTPERAGSFRIEATAEDSRGNEIASVAYVWIEGGPVASFNPETPKLSITFDKKKYKVGDIAKVMVETASPGGTALLTLEADGVHFTKTLELKQNVTVTEVPLKGDCSPNVWASACYVRDKTFNEATERVEVEALERNLTVTVEADKKVYRPGETVRLSVQTKDPNGKGVPAEVSVGVVDEGVYAILEDQTDIKEGFYPMRENRVVTAYSFPELYLDGGDKGAPDVDVRRDFRDTAYWNPVVRTDAEGRAKLSFKLPDNLTEWRATVVGATEGTAVGMAKTSFVARKPLMVRLSAPRVMVVGDEQRLVAQVANDTGRDATVQLQLEADGLALDGAARREVRVANGQQQALEWTASAERSGPASVTAKAWIDGGDSDGVELKIEVKPYGRLVQSQYAGDFKDRVAIDFELQPGADLNSARLRLVLTPSAAYSLYQSLEGLMGYPYGCVEQTMSRFMPSVVVSQLAKSGRLPRFAREKEVPRFVSDGYARLYKMQHQDGGWGWWESDASDPFMTAYVLEGMRIAANAGYPPNKFSVERALKWAKAYLPKAPALGPNEAYLAYAISLYGLREEAAGVLARVDAKKDPSLVAAYKVLAYRLMGPCYGRRLEEAKQTLLAGLQTSSSTSWWTGSLYGDELNARGLMALSAVEPDNPAIPRVARYLMLQRKGDMWASTRGTAFAVLGLAGTLSREAPVPPGTKVEVRLNGAAVETLELSEAALQVNGLAVDVPLSGLKSGANRLELVKNKPGTAYYAATLEQTVQRRQLGEVLSGSDLRLTRQYFPMEVQTLDDGTRKLLPAKKPATVFRKGDILKCVIKISSSREREFLIVEDPLPAGFMVAESAYYDPYMDWAYAFNAMDVRDDRTATFIRRLPKGETEISYMMRAESPGKSTALPTVTYNMYDPQDRASTGETTLEVRE